MIEELKNINEKYIEEYKENPKELKKYEIIKKILNEKDCFFKDEYRICLCDFKRFKNP